MTATDRNVRKALTRRQFFASIFPLKKSPVPAPPAPSAPPEEAPVPGRFSLSALKYLPEAVMAQMVPVLRQGWSASVQNNTVVYRSDTGNTGVVPLCTEGCAAVRNFDGARTLEQIATALETELGRPPGSLFPPVREAFLALSAREVYHPNGPPRDT